jgi:LysR family hydrogen peroxide-inducible transcriptional activator
MTRLSLLELQVLVALDDGKTLTQISRELFLRHPSISRALHGAEQKTGVCLTEPAGRRLILTSAGVELAARAREVLAQHDDLDRLVEDLRDGEAGTVRALATRTASTYILPPVLQKFVADYTRASVSLQVATPGEVWQRFVSERHDLAIGPRTHNMPADAEWLFDDQDALYVRPSDDLVKSARNAALYVPTLVAPIAQEQERHVDEHLRRRNVSFGRRLDIRSLEAAKQLVEAGVGAGLFSRSTVTRELADGRLAELSWLHLDLTTSWYLGERRGRNSRLVERMATLISAETRPWRAKRASHT